MPDVLQARSHAPSPRAAGVVYLLFFITSALGLYLARSGVVAGDAAATAAAMHAHEDAFRAGLALTLASNALYIAVTALFYRLFGPAGWTVSLVAAFLSLAGCIVQIVAALFEIAAMLLLADAQLATVFGVPQLQAAAVFSLGLYSQSFTLSLVLFGLYDLLLGWLVYRSGWVPRVIGVLLLLAGVGWLTFLWPPLARSLSAVVLPLGGFAELVLMLWLLAKGNRAQADERTVIAGG